MCKPEIAALRSGFLADLASIAPRFTWRIDPHVGIRGRHPEFDRDICPFDALYLTKFGALDGGSEDGPGGNGSRAKNMHDRAEEMGLGSIALDVVHSVDVEPDNELGLKIQGALGIGGKGRKRGGWQRKGLLAGSSG